MANIKTSIIVTLVCSSTLYLLQDLKDKYIKNIDLFIGHTMYKDIMFVTLVIQGGGKWSCTRVELLFTIEVKLASIKISVIT